MEKNLRKLQLIFKMTGLKSGMFYSIRVDEFTISMQGLYSNKLNLMARNLLGTPNVNKHGFINYNRGNLNIVLT